jgi:hypothetical protein
MNRELGQFMTPPAIAKLVAKELGQCDVAIDFAVGDGSLLNAVIAQSKDAVRLIGFDIDTNMARAARAALGNAIIRNSDGLKARLAIGNLDGKVGIVGNPPFVGDVVDECGWIKKAFPDVDGKKGSDRAEVQFLARALVVGRAVGARVSIILPIGFGDGDTYRRIRTSLMQNYRLLKCIEVIGTPFQDTEARTVVLVIDASLAKPTLTEICEYDCLTQKLTRVAKKHLSPGARLDARYHRVQEMAEHAGLVQLKDLHVSVTRGLYSRKEAELLNVGALHTSDLAKAFAGRLVAKSPAIAIDTQRHVVAKKGDILLPRTGSRVNWNPVVLHSGQAPITDHVFRIRAPKAVRDLVYRSFAHPAFDAWLRSISKGVCATVITKRELLEMPVFAWSESRVAA